LRLGLFSTQNQALGLGFVVLLVGGVASNQVFGFVDQVTGGFRGFFEMRQVRYASRASLLAVLHFVDCSRTARRCRPAATASCQQP
jgi:hypothetical protein